MAYPVPLRYLRKMNTIRKPRVPKRMLFTKNSSGFSMFRATIFFRVEKNELDSGAV